MTTQPPSRLHRALGVPGAVVVGLSAMLGTGVFAVWTPAWELAGSALLLALALAAMVAMLNAASTARLARVHPESGGAYAYGRIRLGRGYGVAAGVAFVVGKSASAAAAALTIGVYAWPGHERLVGLIAIVVALAIDLRGIVRSTRVNAVLVAIVLAVIVVTVVWGAVSLPSAQVPASSPDSSVSVVAAAGLLFVAFAGYARITVLGEEVRDPRRTIPRAMVWSFAAVLVVYVAVALVVLAAASSGTVLGPAPLESVAGLTGSDALRTIVAVGAVIGAGSVLINLIAGIGRTVFAMASRGDAPAGLAAVSARRMPHRAAVVAAVLAALLVLPGQLPWALGLSGASILIYYSIAHAASLTLPGPWVLRWVTPIAGLILCVGIVLGLAWAA